MVVIAGMVFCPIVAVTLVVTAKSFNLTPYRSVKGTHPYSTLSRTLNPIRTPPPPPPPEALKTRSLGAFTWVTFPAPEFILYLSK